MRRSSAKTAAVLVLSFLCIHMAQSPSLGVVIRGGDGSGNTTAPTDDPGWAKVGRRGVGSAIYLGNGWVLTADHVNIGSVMFDTTYSAQAGTFHQLHDPNNTSVMADIGVFQLSSIPAGLQGVTISSAAPSTLSTITAIGYGADRGAATTWDRHPGFLTSTVNRTKRWGENTIDASGITVESTYGTTSTLEVDFDIRGGSGDNEFQGYYGDSGGAFFYDNGTNWELAGMMVAIGTYTGQPDNMVLYGNATYAADLSVYRDQILAITAHPGDVNGDGIVNFLDYNIVETNYLKTGVGWTGGDLNDDGVVSFLDYNIVKTHYLHTNVANGTGVLAVPEPATMSLLILGGMATLIRRRNRRA